MNMKERMEYTFIANVKRYRYESVELSYLSTGCTIAPKRGKLNIFKNFGKMVR